jgi:hypothetical protein
LFIQSALGTSLRPGGGKDLVGPPAKQEGVGGGVVSGLLSEHLVVSHDPVLGRFDDPVEGHVLPSLDLAHENLLRSS